MLNTILKSTALGAAMIMVIGTATASAEISINTDTGVSVEQVMSSGVKPEVRIMYPENSVNANALGTQVVTTRTMIQASPMPATRIMAEQSTQTAARIASETGSTLVTVDGEAPVMTDNTSVILPDGNTLAKMGTTTHTAPLYKADSSVETVPTLDNNSHLNSYGALHNDMALGADVRGSYSSDTASNISSLRNSSGIRAASRSSLSGSVNSLRSGSMAGTSR